MAPPPRVAQVSICSTGTGLQSHDTFVSADYLSAVISMVDHLHEDYVSWVFSQASCLQEDIVDTVAAFLFGLTPTQIRMVTGELVHFFACLWS
jgi:hypothetical protein